MMTLDKTRGMFRPHNPRRLRRLDFLLGTMPAAIRRPDEPADKTCLAVRVVLPQGHLPDLVMAMTADEAQALGEMFLQIADGWRETPTVVRCPVCDRNLYGAVAVRGICFGCLPAAEHETEEPNDG